MILTLISDDIDLYQQLVKTGAFNDVKLSEKFEEDNSNIIVISDKKLSFNNFISLSEVNSKKTIYYMLSDIYQEGLDNIYTILKSRQVEIIPPKLTRTQIIEKILMMVVPDFNKHRNVITFFGADNKVGTTNIAQTVAFKIAKETNLKVCLLFLNGDNSTTYLKDNALGIDLLKAKIFNKMLTPIDLVESCIKENNLYILPGITNLRERRLYHPEHIEYLINCFSKEFGVVVIDAGSNIDNAMSIASLNSTYYKYLVTTQQKTATTSFLTLSTNILQYLNITAKDFILIVNKYIETSALPNDINIADMYKTALAGRIPYMDILGWQAEEEGKLIYDYEERKYNVAIDSLVKVITTQLELEYINKEIKEKDRFFNFIRRKANG